MKRYLLFLVLVLSFCFNWNRVEAKSIISREEKGYAGLDYNRFRYYSPEEGLYISQDPIGLAGGDRFYGYVKDPNSFIDPFGLEAKTGGSYYEVRKTNTAAGNGGEVNHSPANSVTDLTHGKGPSVWMETEDHRQTASWGSSNEAKEYRAQQGILIDQGRFGDAMGMDVDDIRSKFGDKYDDGLKSMIDYAEGEGLIDKNKADDLKSKCGASR